MLPEHATAFLSSPSFTPHFPKTFSALSIKQTNLRSFPTNLPLRIVCAENQATELQSQAPSSITNASNNALPKPIDLSTQDNISQHHDSSIPSNAVPYFAYFSNMNPQVMGPLSKSTLRQFNIHKTVPAVLHGYKLSFDVPGIPPEPLFANISPAPNHSVYGVIHWISPPDFYRLALSEGAAPDDFPLDLPNFLTASAIINVNPTAIGDHSSKLSAKTFQFQTPKLPPPLQAALRPSRRYITAGIDGARHWGLPRHYIASLQAIKTQTGVLGAFGLLVPQRPHLLDRVDPSLDYGKATSEMYSPFSTIRARGAVEAFESNEPGQSGLTLSLIRLSNISLRRGKLRKPMYFIPGIDGTGKSILSQIDDMDRAGVYDVHSLVYPFSNRQSLPELAASIADIIREDADGRPVTIVAESMGGILSMMLAKENVRRRQEQKDMALDIDLLLLINPATCYTRAPPNALWDFLLGLGLSEEQYAALLPPVMLPFVVDVDSMRENFGPSIAPRLVKMLGALSKVSDVLPQDSLNHRLRLMKEFSFSNDDYNAIGGEFGPKDIALISAVNDNLIPSLSESFRMRRKIPKLYTMLLPFGGHAPMFDVRFSLDKFLQPFKRKRVVEVKSAEVVSPKILRRREAFQKKFAVDPSRPGPQDKKTRQEMRTLRDFLSQSTKESSPVFIGEENIPDRVEGKSVLFVSNHTILGWYDAMHPIQRILDSKQVLIRSLGHPDLLQMTINQFPGTTSFTKEDLVDFGVVPISPRSLLEQMSRGNWCLLFPGGAREALKQPSEPKYSVFWPENAEFIRSCALFGVTIVPVSTIGTEDMIKLIIDSKTGASIFEAGRKLVGSPIDYTIPSSDPATQWRGDGETEFPLFPPFGIPAGVQRFYYRFGKPLTVPAEALDNQKLAQELYSDIKSRVVEGVEILKERRGADMYESFEKRKEFAERYGDNIQPPAGLGWAWSQGVDSYLDEEFQPPL